MASGDEKELVSKLRSGSVPRGAIDSNIWPFAAFEVSKTDQSILLKAPWVLDFTMKVGGLLATAIAALVPSPLPPIGYVYFQLAGMSAPGTLWPPDTLWTNISSTFAGRFFRAEGGNAITFGSAQAQNIQPHAHSGSVTINGVTSSSTTNSPSGWIWGGAYGYATKSSGSSFTTNNAGSVETRPINSTIRIWERTS